MYHINHEGKVYPCRAKVRSCPYGQEWHAETKEELYYKSMKFSPEVKIPYEVRNEIAITGRIKSLYSLSETLEKVPYPIESLVKNLEHSIKAVKDKNPDHVKGNWDRIVEEASEKYALTLRHNVKVDQYLPPEITSRGREIFNNTYAGKRASFSSYSKNSSPGVEALRDLTNMKEDLRDYAEYRKFGLTHENKANTVGWMEEDFYQFSHDLNTSKMLTRPMFYGNIKEAKKKIKNLDDFELLGAYDDYLTSDKEIMDNVRLANNFEYNPRRDLTPEANINVKKWYDRNKSIVEDWVNNAPKRVLLSMEMANELDRRGIMRQENATGRKI